MELAAEEIRLATKSEERRLASEERQREMDYKHTLELKRLRIEAAQVSSRSKRVITSSRDVNEDGDPDFRNEPKKLPVPKFENRQLANVAKYLEVFEGVVKQNGYEEYVATFASNGSDRKLIGRNC